MVLSRQENDTRDKIFLLSIDEVEKYLPTEKERKIYSDDGNLSLWWLRSQGKSINFIAFVNGNGKLISSGININDKNDVRPALWVDLSDY